MAINSVIRPILAAVLLVFVGPLVALAQSTAVSLGVTDHDSSLPVEITSEELSLDQANSIAIFTGNVLARQGELTMTCGKMHVEYGPGADGKDEIKIIRMFDGVTLASPAETAESTSAVYDMVNESLVMTGNVLITQGLTALASDRMTYDLASGNGILEGNVKTVLGGGN